MGADRRRRRDHAQMPVIFSAPVRYNVHTSARINRRVKRARSQLPVLSVEDKPLGATGAEFPKESPVATTNGKEQGSRTVSTYLPANLVDALAAKARAEDRTLSQVIRRTLRTALRAEVR